MPQNANHPLDSPTATAFPYPDLLARDTASPPRITHRFVGYLEGYQVQLIPLPRGKRNARVLVYPIGPSHFIQAFRWTGTDFVKKAGSGFDPKPGSNPHAIIEHLDSYPTKHHRSPLGTWLLAHRDHGAS